MQRNNSIFKTLDWWTFIIYLMIVLAGWFNVAGASYNYDQTSLFDPSYRSGMQLIWIATGTLIGFFILFSNSRLFNDYAYIIYVGAIILLLITLIFAKDIKGSRSWLKIGPFSIQSAEFAKVATALAVAKIMSRYGFVLKTVRDYAKVLILIFIPMGIIVAQKETGSALVYLSFIIMLYREGLPGLIPFLGFCMVVVSLITIRFGSTEIGGVEEASLGILLSIIFTTIVQLIFIIKNYKIRHYALYVLLGNILIFGIATLVHLYIIPVNFLYVGYATIALSFTFHIVNSIKFVNASYLWIGLFLVGFTAFSYSTEFLVENVLQTHQRNRILIILGMIDDPLGQGYNVNQAKIAIGSGGLVGKGFLNGTQTKLKYVPEQDTDFIFCSVGEEFGYIGATFVLLLYSLLIYKCIAIAERQPRRFGRVYGYSVAGIFAFHVIINIGMVIGILPVIGIPLPFFSYGGSSFWAFSILLFILLRLDIARHE